MIDTTNRPPLWWAMQGAYFEGRNPGFSDRHGYAAEIRAVAEWIEQRQVEDYLATVPRPHHTDVPKVIGWLTAEADRAERGEKE